MSEPLIPNNDHRNVVNTLGRPPTAGAFSRVNFVNFGLGYWGIDNVPVTATAAQLNAAGSGGFDYLSTVYVGVGGNDLNSGNANEPLATLNAAALMIPSGGIIRILDNQNYTITSTINITGPTLIDAGGASINWSGAAAGNMFVTALNSPLIFYGNKIFSAGTQQVFRGLSSIYVNGPAGFCTIIDALNVWLDDNISPNGVPQAIFNIDSNSGARFVFGYSGQQIINALNLDNFCTITSLLTSGSGNSCIVNCDNFDGTLAGTADYVVNIPNITSTAAITTTGNVNGIFGSTYGGITVTPQTLDANPFGAGYLTNQLKNTIYAQSGTTLYIDETMSGKLIVTPDNTVIIGLPNVLTYPNFPERGFFVDIAQGFAPSGCQISWSSLNDTVIRQPSSTPFYTGQGACRVYLLVKGNPGNGNRNVWCVTGDVFNSNLTFAGQNIVTRMDSPEFTFTNLATASQVSIITADTPTAQYAINNILLNGVGSTNFSGGDRDLSITDGTNVWTVIPAATLQALVNDTWNASTTNVPFPVSVPLNEYTIAGANLYAVYSGGTTDYTAGSVSVTVEYERVTV